MTDTGIFFFCIEVKPTNCIFQFIRYFSETACILRGRVDNASVAFLKSLSIFRCENRNPFLTDTCTV